MGKPQISVLKRQREQARRERQQQKAEKRAQRKAGDGTPADETENTVVEEGTGTEQS